jgi:hypothetical protein
VVFGCHSEIGAAHRATSQTQAIECLRAGDLMYEMKIDIEKVGFTFSAVYHVLVPHFLRES